MTSYIILAEVLSFLSVHGPDGKQEIDINVAEISSIRTPREDAESHFAPGTHCLIFMTAGTVISTRESCLQIIRKIAAHEYTIPKEDGPKEDKPKAKEE